MLSIIVLTISTATALIAAGRNNLAKKGEWSLFGLNPIGVALLILLVFGYLFGLANLVSDGISKREEQRILLGQLQDATSERDEVKSKLARLEQELNKNTVTQRDAVVVQSSEVKQGLLDVIYDEKSKSPVRANATLSFIQVEKMAGNRPNLKNARLDTPTAENPVELIGQQLGWTNFRGARFTNARLNFSGFEDSDLRDAELRDCEMVGAKFWRTRLHNADMTGANLTRALLATAKLDGANLKGALYDEETTFPPGFSPEDAGMKKIPPK